MVQTKRYQHAVGESVDERAECARAGDEPAEPGQARVEDRIEVAQRESQEQRRHRHHDRHEPPAAEEAEIRRQHNGVVAVEQPCGEQADDDPAEHLVVDLRLFTGLVELTGEHERRHRLEHRLHHQVSDGGRQRGRAVGLAGEADRDTDGEQQRQVVEQRPTGGAHRLEERPDHRCLDPAQQVVLAQPQQDARRREDGDRQHQALAEALQLRETRYAQSRLLLCP